MRENASIKKKYANNYANFKQAIILIISYILIMWGFNTDEVYICLI